MELLSPAGNLKHVDLAINKKVDAVYGGLKEWNARNKAMNFSIEEYNRVVKQLHKNGIKFYLTLNTLVFDEEIEDIINFLERKDTILPDSFIIADIGLIRKINNKFPNVPLHFSTQFGIHNITDCNFAENLGAERAILARELTFDEIKNINENTRLEIENFVWGSQCISFSGLCFFGSLINCGNGNRGKCVITCRDIYQVENNEGHFLYVPDLDCTAMINNHLGETI
ncbi:MAG: U32 family peptidase, partial [Clostridia bacterium]|nr:U32 family peptidase [Clostridia bacterium]